MFMIIGGDGKEYGPVKAELLRRWMAEGRVTMDSRIQRFGETEWKRLGDLAEFAILPPPIPTPSLPDAAAAYEETMERPVEHDEYQGPPLASRQARFAAMLIDATISMLFALPGLMIITKQVLSHGLIIEDLASLQLHPDTPGFNALMIGMMIPSAFQVMLLALRAQTIGKWLVRIRIVHVDTNEHPGFLKVVGLRSLVPGLIGGIPVLGPFFTLADGLFILRHDKRCIHDLLAGTKVVSIDQD